MNGGSGYDAVMMAHARPAPSGRPFNEPGGGVQAVVWLASRSPRRRALLETAGIQASQAPELLDDGGLRPGSVPPVAWVQALAFLKAAFARERLLRSGLADEASVVLAADTLCLVDGEVLGQPSDRSEAEEMIRRLTGRSHETLTGVCMLRGDKRVMLTDVAVVTLGDLSQAERDAYLVTDAWRGKAGGYNLTDRLAAGWPLSCVGDPTTVVGLPMQRVLPLLRQVGGGAEGG